MRHRSLHYTVVTRAQKPVIIIGDKVGDRELRQQAPD